MRRKENKGRGQDEKKSDHAHKMLERVFYVPETTGYKGIDDKETQVKGVDSIFTYNGKTYHCDEKAPVRWVQKNLRTFSMELSFIDRSNKLADGWFIKDGVETDSYLLMWFDDDYEVALVNKSDIRDYLERLGWDVDKLSRKAEKIRYEGDTNFGRINEDRCKFSYSNYDWMPEKPINVLVPRDELVKMAVYAKKFQYEEEDKKILGVK